MISETKITIFTLMPYIHKAVQIILAVERRYQNFLKVVYKYNLLIV